MVSLRSAMFAVLTCSSLMTANAHAQSQEVSKKALALEKVTADIAGKTDKVTLFAPIAITGLKLNGKVTPFNAVTPSTIEVIIQADESGYICTNLYEVEFADKSTGKLTANHCHGETVFAVQAGKHLQHIETHDGEDNDGVPDDGNSGKVKLLPQYKWHFFGGEDPQLSLGVPETDDIILIAKCLPKRKSIKAYILMIPEKLSDNDLPQFSYQIDNAKIVEYSTGLEQFPFGEGGKSPVLYTNSKHSFYKMLARGNTALFTMNGIKKAKFSLKDSAKAIKPFLAACLRLENKN